MNIQKKTIEVINYQFVAVPSKLVYICDPYTLTLLTYLIDRESYWKAKNRLTNDYFFVSIEEIGKIICLNDRKDIRCTIEGLFRAKLIDVKCEGLGKGNNNKIANSFKINWEKVNELDRIPFDEITTFNISISKVGRKEILTYTQS